jgi:hypothetical protein
MKLWDKWLTDFANLVRASLYPPDAGERIVQGRAEFQRLDRGEREQLALNARVILRMCASFPGDGAAMRRYAGDMCHIPANLFAMDDLLRRYPAMLAQMNPADPPSPEAMTARDALMMLHITQYFAEEDQDVLVGSREPR